MARRLGLVALILGSGWTVLMTVCIVLAEAQDPAGGRIPILYLFAWESPALLIGLALWYILGGGKRQKGDK